MNPATRALSGTSSPVKEVLPERIPVRRLLLLLTVIATALAGIVTTAVAAGPGGPAGSDGPADPVRAVLNIGPDRTVGVAAPIAITFDKPVTDRAAVERKLSVQTSVPVEGSWAWLPSAPGTDRVHWRPREYWPAGTEVAVSAPLGGHDYGDGRTGITDIVSTFTIGRAQVVHADIENHRFVVERDGEVVADYPASYGSGRDPNLVTRSGIHVVTEFHEQKHMVSERYGYDLVVDWAVRISNNGEFVHASENSLDFQGRDNVTHGCINLSPADAQEYYHSAMFGDPVEVTGSDTELSEADGDVFDWTLSWEYWQTLSAL